MFPSLTVGLKPARKEEDNDRDNRVSIPHGGLKTWEGETISIRSLKSPSLTVGLKRMYVGKASVPTSAELLVSTPHGGLATRGVWPKDKILRVSTPHGGLATTKG